MEKFQKEVAKGHSAAKKALLSGGAQNSPPFTQKPDYERSKSAPAGFGAIGESEELPIRKKLKVRLVKKVEEDKLIPPEQVKKDREKRIHKPKEREREKKTGIISPKFAKVYEV